MYTVNITDSTKISISDLENILETETPPQSPPATSLGEVTIDTSNNVDSPAVRYKKKCDSERERRARTPSPLEKIQNGMCGLVMV